MTTEKLLLEFLEKLQRLREAEAAFNNPYRMEELAEEAFVASRALRAARVARGTGNEAPVAR